MGYAQSSSQTVHPLLRYCLTVQSAAYRAQVKEMAGLYPTLAFSLACGASAFFSPIAMPPVRAGVGFQRTAAILSSSTGRLLRGGSSSVATRMSSSSSEHFDYLVIGGGSGGVSSARRASTYDVKVRCFFLGGVVCATAGVRYNSMNIPHGQHC